MMIKINKLIMKVKRFSELILKKITRNLTFSITLQIKNNKKVMKPNTCIPKSNQEIYLIMTLNFH